QWQLNAAQAEALSLAYGTDLVHLIQGPPGTGKTRVLAYLAQLLAEDGERVLITGFTHRAINQALNTLADNVAREDAPLTLAKIGHHVHVHDLRAANYASFHDSPLADLSGGYVIGATPFATRSKRLAGVEFDTVIFDEASQITLPLAVMGMLPARRTIFVGDHRQLPPVLTSRYGATALRESVFAALIDQGFDTMLEESYRLNAALVAWPSQQFYDGQLRAAEVARQRRVIYPRPPARLQHILDPDAPKVFVDLGHQNATTRSPAEADLTVALIATLLECDFPAAQIGVVVPFRNQARLIRNQLATAVPQAATRRALVVDTVERMQGQERDLIIVSLTDSSPGFIALVADFLLQPERINVAITRPRVKLIILGSRHLLRSKLPDPDQQAMVDLLADLVQSCTWRSAQWGGGHG
ncbi:MAG: AAA family ATPase, partial [Chloroflexales bacterium]|nr:AAA family ATPase [Chloroflexales bacterium]